VLVFAVESPEQADHVVDRGAHLRQFHRAVGEVLVEGVGVFDLRGDAGRLVDYLLDRLRRVFLGLPMRRRLLGLRRAGDDRPGWPTDFEDVAAVPDDADRRARIRRGFAAVGVRRHR
jgi:hypothetical protein